MRLDVELDEPREVQRPNDDLLSNFERLDVEEDLHGRVELAPQRLALESRVERVSQSSSTRSAVER
jgi:hypothetical protein